MTADNLVQRLALLDDLAGGRVWRVKELGGPLWFVTDLAELASRLRRRFRTTSP